MFELLVSFYITKCPTTRRLSPNTLEHVIYVVIIQVSRGVLMDRFTRIALDYLNKSAAVSDTAQANHPGESSG